MEHIFGAELTEDGIHTRHAADGGYHDVGIDMGILLGHHQPQVVLGRLCLIDEHHRCRPTGGNLTDHLRSDGACRTRDEDAATAEQLADGLHIDLDLSTRQQIFNGNLLELDIIVLRLVIIIAGLPVLHVTIYLDSVLGHEYLHTHTNEKILQVLVLTEVVRTIGRHEHGSDMIVFNHLTQVIFHREHFLTHKLVVTQTTVVGDESLEDEATGGLRTNALCQSNTTTLGTIDQHAQGSVVGSGHIKYCLYQHAHTPHGQGGDNVHEDDLTAC